MLWRKSIFLTIFLWVITVFSNDISEIILWWNFRDFDFKFIHQFRKSISKTFSTRNKNSLTIKKHLNWLYQGDSIKKSLTKRKTCRKAEILNIIYRLIIYFIKDKFGKIFQRKELNCGVGKKFYFWRERKRKLFDEVFSIFLEFFPLIMVLNLIFYLIFCFSSCVINFSFNLLNLKIFLCLFCIHVFVCLIWFSGGHGIRWDYKVLLENCYISHTLSLVFEALPSKM